MFTYSTLFGVMALVITFLEVAYSKSDKFWNIYSYFAFFFVFLAIVSLVLTFL